MLFRQLFDADTATFTYLLADEKTGEAVLIDPVRDQIERDVQLLNELGLRLLYTLDTHVHADHVTSSGSLRQRLGSKTVLSRHAGSLCPDQPVVEGDTITFGAHKLVVLETPGHTDSCVSFYSAELGAVFTGDAILIRGCGRTDFQQGDAAKLYHSITTKIFSLPDSTLLYPGHDYRGRNASSVAEEKAHNPRLAGKSEAEFVSLMNALKLNPPKRIAEAVPANMVCGLSVPIASAEPAIRERGWAPLKRAGQIPEVGVDWVSTAPEGVRVVDVRELDEFQGDLGHIAEAELVPLGALEQTTAPWDREAPLVVVCRSGARSGRAAVMLEQAGFKRIASMRGGMMDWNRQSFPVERQMRAAN